MNINFSSIFLQLRELVCPFPFLLNKEHIKIVLELFYLTLSVSFATFQIADLIAFVLF